MTRRDLLERLDAVQAALGPRAHAAFNSSLFGDAALLKRIETFEAQLAAPVKVAAKPAPAAAPEAEPAPQAAAPLAAPAPRPAAHSMPLVSRGPMARLRRTS